MIIFGTRRTIERLLVVALTCGMCGHGAAHVLMRATTRFTPFFIPLFPISTRHILQCTRCGARGQITPDQAQHLASAVQQPAVA